MNIREVYQFYWRLAEKEGSHEAAVERLCDEIEKDCCSASSVFIYLAAIVRNMVGKADYDAAIQKAGTSYYDKEKDDIVRRSYYELLTLIPLTGGQYKSLGFSLLLFVKMAAADEVLHELIQ